MPHSSSSSERASPNHTDPSANLPHPHGKSIHCDDQWKHGSSRDPLEGSPLNLSRPRSTMSKHGSPETKDTLWRTQKSPNDLDTPVPVPPRHLHPSPAGHNLFTSLPFKKELLNRTESIQPPFHSMFPGSQFISPLTEMFPILPYPLPMSTSTTREEQMVLIIINYNY